ncbi:hypothetical protein DUI87_11535 [Hirundo rustica rustica]|uniref:Cilia- and flagella-associated protein 43 n=1 Tax=Hirundo rustica rustica TaxID=333673 RepID=A0A3M0KDY3_HIRRU|nr:hypothetical protein DUI87_11535 [Hirundo rustica rustica]
MAAGPGTEGPGTEGPLEVSWVQGFSNKNLAFVNNQTVCYPCGNYILFLDIKTKKTRAVQCQAGQVGAFAANANRRVVAFSDRKLNPVIHIYTFPELSKLTELKGDAQLDYTLLAFSFRGPYLASYSSVPEFVLSVWNWQENILLCSESQPGLIGTSLSFNPMNWQQLCFVAESSVTIWRVERSGDEHHLTRHPVELPDNCGAVSPRKDLFFPPSRNDDPYYGPDLPVSAIAGLEGDEAETFVVQPMTKTAHNVQEFVQKITDVVSYVRREVQKKKDNDKYVNEQGMFKASDLKKEQYDLDCPLSSAVRLKDNIVYGYCTCAPFICKYHFSEENKLENPSVFLSEEKIPSKQFGSGLLCLSPNSQWLAAAAKDGVLFIYNTSTLEAPLKSFNVQVTEEDGNITNTDDMTWIGQRTQKVMREETRRFANQKEEVQMGIKKLRETIQKMMHENEQVPDIEKLELWEFNLDLEEQKQVQAEVEEDVARARKKVEMETLSYCYLQDLIKYDCWDVMCVKERAVKCFHINCQVSNYPLKERSKEELETLKKVLQLKKTETANLKAQKKNLEADSETALSEEEEEKAAEMADGASHWLNGSLSSQYGGDTSILYHQCDLHTKEQKLNQIILLKEIIYKVKTAFNEEFDIVVQQKEQEIARVKERNLKIREILEQLELQVEVWEPVLTDDEMPERALTVQDSEIKAEKYMTREETEQAEMLARLEMERRLAAMVIKEASLLQATVSLQAYLINAALNHFREYKFKLDDERPRALDDMMGGVLEIRKEDILKMDIPPPSFISRSEDLWTEEEKKIFEEYEKKVKELNEEKEEYRQFLRNEWNKLETSIKETTKNFDEIVCKLSEKKLKLEMVIYQEELKIVNLIYALLLDEELDTREAGLHKFLMKKKKEKVKGARKMLTAKYSVEAYTGPYKDALHEEKSLEHGFIKQFADVPHDLLEELLHLYRHRPETPRTETLLDTADPYVKGSPEDYQDALSLLMKAMDELDSPEHMPSGLDPSVWECFCLARRSKMESEELVKWKALALTDKQACLQRRVNENDKMKSELENIFQELTWLKEEKMKLQQNVTVQFLLKQGQVELESTQIPDYSDAVLIDRSVVEELNCALAAQGEKKITAMVESKDFSKGIIQLEWEHKKMKMQIQDLKEKARDIVILPISKDCQLFLSVNNYDTHIAQHLAGMEQSLGVMDKMHKKNVKKHQKKVRELKKCIHLKEQANYELSLQLKEMLVSVSERMHIFEAADTRDISKKITRQRYQEIVKQKYLRILIREQEKQLAILRSEAESWKPRTLHIT